MIAVRFFDVTKPVSIYNHKKFRNHENDLGLLQTRRALGRAHYLRRTSLSDSSVLCVFVVLDLDLWPWASTAYSGLPCRRCHLCTKFRQNPP